ncbi:class I SAM-dependent methyltransferase [Coraliomargarita parva]|uniref:class I SAM-dependent methyltransferase n=1 Tax=Coraliomargarita parva TaxID=3014050 RepID=UPI0022B3434B|nr:class I SAM-dependent methyltransferase [Coraliomargarita parva]
MSTPQVDRSHYEFSKYMTLERWGSLWHQLDLSLKLQPDTILEVGAGLGAYRKVIESYGPKVTTVDVAEDLKPDVVASVLELPFDDGSFDVACAFQVLEHLPYENFIPAVKELARVARKAVLISLPDAKPVYPFRISIPGVGIRDFMIPRPYVRKKHVFDGQHYWEMNKKDTPVSLVVADIIRAGFPDVHHGRYVENLYHHFLSFGVRSHESGSKQCL